ncbi:hypothetical protein BDN72DRAFT_734482, partial [Pluteus cervinus]
LLLWIAGLPRPQEIRDKLMENVEFKNALIAYLEGAYQGELSTGSVDDVKIRVAQQSKPGEGYKDPIENLPTPPPSSKCILKCMMCTSCKEYQDWYQKYLETTDDILIKSNLHQ